MNGRTGEPTDYDEPRQKHPDLYRTSHIIRTGDELRRLCARCSHNRDDVRRDTRPWLVTHADWSNNPQKRWCAIAALDADGSYRVDAPELVGDLTTFFGRLLARAGVDAVVLSGFDFPIGLPACYAGKAGLTEFRAALSDFGRGRWSHFYDPAPSRSAISVTRPFYPRSPGGAKQEHLVDALGVPSFRELYRRCDQGSGRNPAEAIFWLVGPKQVGRAAITGWRDLIAPAMVNDPPPSIWPFDGRMADLLARPGLIVAETYPAEVYRYLNLEIRKNGRSKRRQPDRAADSRTVQAWACTNRVRLTSRLQGEIADGFGADNDGEDRFDAVVGLLGMLDVVLGNLPSGEPEDDTTRIEGWILGQPVVAPESAANG